MRTLRVINTQEERNIELSFRRRKPRQNMPAAWLPIEEKPFDFADYNDLIYGLDEPIRKQTPIFTEKITIYKGKLPYVVDELEMEEFYRSNRVEYQASQPKGFHIQLSYERDEPRILRLTGKNVNKTLARDLEERMEAFLPDTTKVIL